MTMSIEQLKADGWIKEANYIAGEWVGADDGGTYAVENPATEALIGNVPWVGDPPNTHWVFADGRSVNVVSKLSTNNGELGHRWALQGSGLILKSIWDVQEDVASGRLEIVLPEHRLPAAPIHAVFPHNRLAAAKVRLCVDFLAGRLKKASPEL